jgi:surfeit locus 1 family protein
VPRGNTAAGLRSSAVVAPKRSLRLRIGRYELQPSLIPTLLALVMLPLLLGLGFWQLERAAEKELLLEAYERRTAAPPLQLAAAPRVAEPLEHRRTVLVGRYDPAAQILLDNRIRRGRSGYEVITPLRLADGSAVLVNRGWVPLGASRAERPLVPVPRGELVVRGVLKAPSEVYVPGWHDAQAEWPVVLQVDPQRVQARLGYPVWPLLVLLDADEPHGFERGWVLLEMGPERHLGYAVQWFGLALTLLILCLVVSVRRIEIERVQE